MTTYHHPSQLIRSAQKFARSRHITFGKPLAYHTTAHLAVRELCGKQDINAQLLAPPTIISKGTSIMTKPMIIPHKQCPNIQLTHKHITHKCPGIHTSHLWSKRQYTHLIHTSLPQQGNFFIQRRKQTGNIIGTKHLTRMPVKGDNQRIQSKSPTILLQLFYQAQMSLVHPIKKAYRGNTSLHPFVLRNPLICHAKLGNYPCSAKFLAIRIWLYR